MNDAEDTIKAEIVELNARAKKAAAPFEERADYLRKMLDGPTVTPVIHYWRHHGKYEDEYEYGGLAEAFLYCEAMIDSGDAAPEGVSVGGAMITCEEWGADPRCPPELRYWAR